jgi:hypothetical protein
MRTFLTIAATAGMLALTPNLAGAAPAQGDALKAAMDSVSPVESTQFYFGFGPGWGYGPRYGYGYRPYYRPYYGYGRGYGYPYRRYYRPYRYY